MALRAIEPFAAYGFFLLETARIEKAPVTYSRSDTGYDSRLRVSPEGQTRGTYSTGIVWRLARLGCACLRQIS